MKILMLFHDEPSIRAYLREDVLPGSNVSLISSHPYRIECGETTIYLSVTRFSGDIEKFRGVHYDMIDLSNLIISKFARDEIRGVFALSLLR